MLVGVCVTCVCGPCPPRSPTSLGLLEISVCFLTQLKSSPSVRLSGPRTIQRCLPPGRSRPVVVVGNKVDLLPQDSDGYLSRVAASLTAAMERCGVDRLNVKHTCLVSARSGFGIEELITVIQTHWADQGTYCSSWESNLTGVVSTRVLPWWEGCLLGPFVPCNSLVCSFDFFSCNS